MLADLGFRGSTFLWGSELTVHLESNMPLDVNFFDSGFRGHSDNKILGNFGIGFKDWGV
jgi:hypothetical protein